jgi:Flp pilus assembly pilin Flp
METKANDVILVETAKDHRKNQKGVTTVEYAVMLVLVAIAVLGFGSGLSGSVTGVFSQVIAKL